jgi:hypothetical protein
VNRGWDQTRTVLERAEDIYVTDPASTPRVARWGEDPIDWSALLPPRASKSGVRRTGKMDLGWDEEAG